MPSRIVKTSVLNHQRSTGSLRAFLLLVGVLALMGLVYLGQNGQATMTGRRAQDLTQQLERIQRENAQLEVEIAQLTLPSRIAERARALGFRPATISQTVFIVVKNYPVDSKPAVAARPADTASSSELAALWNDLLTWMGLTPASQTVEATGP
jgi:cell division protein FtsB